MANLMFGAMGRFRRDRWPSEGPVRDLLSYLEALHDEAGQPSLADMGRAVALAPSTLSGFFTGSRLIGRGNLELLVEHLGGEVARAESLRRKAVRAWPAPASRKLRPEPLDPTGRLEIVIYEAPVNKLNRPERLLGRRTLIGEVNSLLNSFSRVLLHGLPGSGKTALAATLADQRVESGAGPYLWLRPGTATDPAVVLDALASAFTAWDTAPRPTAAAASPVTPWDSAAAGPSPLSVVDRGATDDLPRSAGDAVLLRLRGAIARSGVTLCVIDDAADPVVLHALLRAMPDDLAVLVTSRRKLAFEHQIELSGLDERDALRLLALHAHDDGVVAQPEAARLCADLGHHPYAIEIAGQQLRQYGSTPAELRSQLAGAPHRLTVPGCLAQPGRESIQRLLDATVSGLDGADAPAVLRAFGALPSPGATVELLAAYLKVEGQRIELALKQLIDLSLTKRMPGSTFHAIHDLTFGYARGLNGPAAEGAVIAAVRTFTAAHREDYDLLGHDLDNLIGAALLAASSDVDAFLGIFEDLAAGQFLNAKGHPLPLLRLLDEAISVLRDKDCPERLHHLLSKRGNAHFNQGEFETALEVYGEALVCAPGGGRRVVLLSVVGKVLAELGRHDEAQARFQQAYALTSATHDEHGRLRVLEQHSVAAFRQKDFRRVLGITTEGIELARRLGSHRLEIYFLNNHGTAQFELGLCAAIDDHERAQRLAAEMGDEQALALTHRTLGADRHAQEDFAAAQQHFEQALALYAKLGVTDRKVKLEHLMRQFGYLS
jgi:tetratricopeptide (TPR) repeat protein